MKQRLALTVTLMTLAVALDACGGGGGGGGGGTVQPPPPSVTFTPSAAATPSTISLQSAGTSQTAVTLEVHAESVAKLYGIAFDLDFPSAVVHFTGSSTGSALSPDANSLLFQAVESSPGHLVVGLSRSGGVAAVASASGPLLTLRFDVLAAGTGNFTFSRTAAFDDQGAALSGVQWNGGALSVVR